MLCRTPKAFVRENHSRSASHSAMRPTDRPSIYLSVCRSICGFLLSPFRRSVRPSVRQTIGYPSIHVSIYSHIYTTCPFSHSAGQSLLSSTESSSRPSDELKTMSCCPQSRIGITARFSIHFCGSPSPFIQFSPFVPCRQQKETFQENPAS